jgi:hypothetical protein
VENSFSLDNAYFQSCCIFLFHCYEYCDFSYFLGVEFFLLFQGRVGEIWMGKLSDTAGWKVLCPINQKEEGQQTRNN